jgi:hypothetical protein
MQLENEIRNDHMFLCKFCLVSMWGITEAKIDDIIYRYVSADPSVLIAPAFSKIVIPVDEALAMTKPRVYLYVINQFKERTNASLKRGIGRFETLLEAIDLGGGVPPGARRAFMEMAEIRHCADTAKPQFLARP